MASKKIETALDALLAERAHLDQAIAALEHICGRRRARKAPAENGADKEKQFERVAQAAVSKKQAKRRKGLSDYWASLSPEEHQARVAKAQAGLRRYHARRRKEQAGK